MKYLLIILLSSIFSLSGFAHIEFQGAGDPPSYKAPNGKTYTWSKNFDQLSVDYTLAELVKMPVWICCGNTSFRKLPSDACQKGILNSGIKPHQVQNLSAEKQYTNSLGEKFTPDLDRLRLFGFCIVEGDSRSVYQEVDPNRVCDELKEQMAKDGIKPCNDLTPQNVYPDYEKQLIYYTVCGKTYSRPITEEFVKPQKEIIREVVNCVDEFVNLPLVRLCEDEVYNWSIDDTTYVIQTAGTFMHTTPKADNCGKVISILNLDYFASQDTMIIPAEKFDFMAGEVYSFEGMVFDSAGTYTKVYTDRNGCVSKATLILQEKPAPQIICPDCKSNARDLGNIEVAARLNYGSQPVSTKSHPINSIQTQGGLEAGYWKEFPKRDASISGISCKNNLTEWGILGGIITGSLYSGESTECDCNDATLGSSVHAYLEPGVRTHLLGLCDRYSWLPIPVVGLGLRMHYNDHKIDDISKLTFSPKLSAEGRWYFAKAFRTSTSIALNDEDRSSISSLFFGFGGEAFAPGFNFGDLDYMGYLKLGYRF